MRFTNINYIPTLPLTHNCKIIRSYYEPRQCTCVTDAWMETGPTMVCLQALCNPFFGGDSELPFCKDPSRSLSVIESAEAFGTFEELAVNCGVPYFTYER